MALKGKFGVALVAGFAAALAIVRVVDAAPSYSATPLGTLGGNGSSAFAINASGSVTGFSYFKVWIPPYPSPTESAWHAFLYSSGVIRDLGTLGGPSAGRAINDTGQIAGFSDFGAGQQTRRHAVLFANGTITDLGTLGGTESEASGINASGQIVGDANLAGDTVRHAFLYSDGVMTDLGTPAGMNSSASGINASGQIVGVAVVPSSPAATAACGSSPGHAYLYSNGEMRDLGTLSGGCQSDASAINDVGQVTGNSDTNVNTIVQVETHAFLWSDGAMQDLGTLGGYTYSAGYNLGGSSYSAGINSRGQVVGWSVAPDGEYHAFLYTDGTMYDLNQLVVGLAGTLLSTATAINDKGQIVVNGCSAGLVCQAFRLDPIAARSTPVTKVAAVEYYYPAFDHYFVTALPQEIAALDGGMFPGWVRTGGGFNVYSDPSLDSAFVCRLFSTSFGPKSSHFYSADPGECSFALAGGDWQLEGNVMSLPIPDSAGNCAAGTQPVYRLYNNGQGGAPAHRYTTSFSVRSQMLAQGWISEGYGDNGVTMCSPD